MADTDYIMDEPAAARAKYKVDPGAVCKRLINYTTGSSTPQPQHYPGLSEILRSMAASGDKVYIIGHASRQGHGSFDNKGLSEQRAKQVYDWFSSRVSPQSNSFEVHGEADTETLGTTPNDPRDRAVVVIAQSPSAPRPSILPPIEPPTPHDGPDGPLKVDIPWPWRLSGWKISSVSGGQLLMPIGGPGSKASVGPAVMTVELLQMRSGKTARYTVPGVVNAGGFDALSFLGKLGGVRKSLMDLWEHRFRPSPSGSPSSWTTRGSELVVTSWVSEPVEKQAFARSAFMNTLSASVGFGAGASLLVLSAVPFNEIVIPTVPISLASTVAVGVFESGGVSLPGGSIEAFHGHMVLGS